MNTMTVLTQTPTGVGVEPHFVPGFEDFQTFVSFVLWGGTLFGVLAMVIGGGYTAWKRSAGYDERGGPNGAMMLFGGLAVAVSSVVVRFVLIGSGTTDPAADETTTPEPTPVPEPPAEAASPASPFDWTPVIYLGVAVAALAVVALTAYVVVRTRHRILDRAAAAATLTADFAAARAVYDDVASRYAEYLADPYAIFIRPLLDDLGDPRTAAFIDAFAEAGALNTETCPDSKNRVQAFADAARTALAAWKDADGHARAIGLGVRTDADKRTVRRIRSALDLALDDSAAAGEREAAMATVQRLSDGLMTVPDRIYARAKTALETTTRKQLTR